GSLFSKTANPELPALIRHGSLPRHPCGSREREAIEQARDKEQQNYRNAEAEPGQSELRQQRDRALTGSAQVAAHANHTIKDGIHKHAAIETVAGQRLFSPALRAVVRAIAAGVGDIIGVLFGGAGERGEVLREYHY